MDEIYEYFVDDEAARPRAHRPGLLPEHVRRRALLRHRHPRHPPDGPQDRTTPAFRTSARSRPRWRPAPRAPSAADLKNKTVTINDEKCMYCGNCYTVCPAMPIADPDNDGISIWVGGKVSNARSAPMFSKLAIPYPAEQSAALAGNGCRGEEHHRGLRQATPGSTSGSASGSSASAGSGSSR